MVGLEIAYIEMCILNNYLFKANGLSKNGNYEKPNYIIGIIIFAGSESLPKSIYVKLKVYGTRKGRK